MRIPTFKIKLIAICLVLSLSLTLVPSAWAHPTLIGIVLDESEAAEFVGESAARAVVATVLTYLAGTLLSLELEYRGLNEAYQAARLEMDEAAGRYQANLSELRAHNPRDGLKTTCPRCDAIEYAKSMMNN